jgi:hypothetical protein
MEGMKTPIPEPEVGLVRDAGRQAEASQNFAAPGVLQVAAQRSEDAPGGFFLEFLISAKWFVSQSEGLAPRPGLEPGTLRLTVARKASSDKQ